MHPRAHAHTHTHTKPAKIISKNVFLFSTDRAVNSSSQLIGKVITDQMYHVHKADLCVWVWHISYVTVQLTVSWIQKCPHLYSQAQGKDHNYETLLLQPKRFYTFCLPSTLLSVTGFHSRKQHFKYTFTPISNTANPIIATYWLLNYIKEGHKQITEP
jgi:hypothetical protein